MISSKLNNDLTLVQTFRNTLVHEMTTQGLLVSRFDTLYTIADLNNPKLKKLGSVKISLSRQIGRIRLIDRVAKYSIQHAFHIPDVGFIAMNNHKWWRITKSGKTKAIQAPFKGRLMARSACLANNELFYFAQYNLKQTRDKALIMATRDFQSYSVSWKFPPLTIRHIHAIIKDPTHKTRIWVLTGDYDHESRFYYTDDYFKTINSLPCFGQKTRATDLLITKKHLLWGMDSPNTYSSILTWKKNFTSPPTDIMRLPGPAYYLGTNDNEHIYIGTTAEPGPATKNNQATLWGKTPRTGWQQLITFSSDNFPQYAMIFLPRNPLPGNFLVFSTRAVKKYDGTMFIFQDNTSKPQNGIH